MGKYMTEREYVTRKQRLYQLMMSGKMTFQEYLIRLDELARSH